MTSYTLGKVVKYRAGSNDLRHNDLLGWEIMQSPVGRCPEGIPGEFHGECFRHKNKNNRNEE